MTLRTLATSPLSMRVKSKNTANVWTVVTSAPMATPARAAVEVEAKETIVEIVAVVGVCVIVMVKVVVVVVIVVVAL